MIHKILQILFLCFRGGKIISEESRGAKSESIFHTLCYQSQMDYVCPEKIELSSMSQRSGWSSIKISGDLSFATKEKAAKQTAKIFFRGGKSWRIPTHGGICHPMPPHGYEPGL